jgi:transposase-like protein
MQMVLQGVSTRGFKGITTKLCGRKFSSSSVSHLAEKLDDQVQVWAECPLRQDYSFRSSVEGNSC